MAFPRAGSGPPAISSPPAISASRAAGREGPDGVIITPAGSTIEPIQEGGYRICDASHHCRRADSLWEAQQLVQWAEVHHVRLDPPAPAP